MRTYRDTEANAVLFREYVLEQIRAAEFSQKPSRLNCMFLLRTFEEAKDYQVQCSPLGIIYQVAVDTANAPIHFGDYNFGGALGAIQGLEGMPQLARKYWSIEPSNTVEALIERPVTIVEARYVP